MLQKPRVLCRRLKPKTLPVPRLGDDGRCCVARHRHNSLVVAFNNRRHDADSAIQLWVGYKHAVKQVGTTCRLTDDLRQPRAFGNVVVL